MSEGLQIWPPVESQHIVVHRREPDPSTIQIKVATTAGGKVTAELNAHAGTVAEALALIEEASQALERHGIMAPIRDIEGPLSASIAALSEAKS